MPARHRLHALLLIAALASGCATPVAVPMLDLDPARSRIWLIGEVHDNAAQHALRLRALDALLARGERPALLMEQIDRERQSEIDRLLAEARASGRPQDAAPATAQAIAALDGPMSGWDWAYYRPYIERAVTHGLPLVAVNVSRDAARRVIREGLAAQGFDAAVPEPLLSAQAQLIEASHCGMVDAALARRMAAAQVARDQAMARAVQQAAGPALDGAVVLLAGNGHVRRDLGVPRWLAAPLATRAVVVGLVEAGGDDPPGDAGIAPYDLRLETPRQDREDPCAGMGGTRPTSTGVTSPPPAQRQDDKTPR
ncbi:ChaN family lipoprotein [Sphaerotilus mobilis]|nr:ChaN family lipoprotein [Sphaerotilus mobilis]